MVTVAAGDEKYRELTVVMGHIQQLLDKKDKTVDERGCRN